MELSGLWSSYTGRDNLPPHCTESAKEGGEGTCPKPDGSGVEMELQPPPFCGGSRLTHMGQEQPALLPACPELLPRWCWSHSAQAVTHGACWHTTGFCSCSYCGIYCILMQLHKGFCDLLGSLQHSLLLSVVCRQSRIVFHVLHTQLTAFDSHPALSSQAVLLKSCQF